MRRIKERSKISMLFSFLAFAIGLLITILSTNNALAQEGTLDKIIRTKEFHIGFVVLPPGISRNPQTNEPEGYYVDVAKFICEQMGVKPIFHEETWVTFISGLQSGKYDLSIASTFQTIPRALAVAFTHPLAYNGTSVVVLKKSKIRTLEDMKKPGIRIGVIQGAFMVPWVKKNFPQAKLLESSASAIVEPMDVIAGRADASVSDSWVCRKFAKEHPDIIDLFGNNPQNITQVGWMVRRNDLELLNFINIAIDYVKTSGVLKSFFDKYEGFEFQPKITWETWGK